VLILELDLNLSTATGANDTRVALKPFKRLLEVVAAGGTRESKQKTCHDAVILAPGTPARIYQRVWKRVSFKARAKAHKIKGLQVS
jgi:hypothetical protein